MLQHTIKQVINAPLDRVYEGIADLRRYGEIHPYMVEVKQIDGEDANATYYRVKEDFLLYGFIPMKPVYDAKILEQEKQKHVQYVSDVMPGVHLTIDFRFVCDEGTGCTEITETILLDAPVLIRTVFMGILKRAHNLFYKKLKDLLQPTLNNQ